MCLTRAQSKTHVTSKDNVDMLPDIGPEITQDSCDYISVEDLQSLNSSENDLMILQLNIRGLISKQSDMSHQINNCSKDKKNWM